MACQLKWSVTYSLRQTSLLAQVGDALLVVMRETILDHDGLGDRGLVHEIDLEQASLERPILRLVILEEVQQQRRDLSDQASLQESINHLHDTSESERETMLRVNNDT